MVMDSPPFLRVLGSLWFAAVLLVLLLVAMAGATVYESAHGTEQALAVFYSSWWFQGLLVLLGVNVLLALVLRWPFSRRQIGFVVTHGSILAVLAGALVTKLTGIDGRVAIAEGQSADEVTWTGRPTLTIQDEKQAQASADLDPSTFSGFEALDAPSAPPLALGNLRAEIEEYVPDSEVEWQVVVDRTRGRPAIEVTVAHAGQSQSDWLFAGASGNAGSIPIIFRLADSTEAVARLLTTAPAEESASKGSVHLTYQGRDYTIPIEQCQESPARVGDTGYTVRVLRYLPHAIVGTGREVVSASSQPLNPYIEAELIGPRGTEQRRAFARFPDHDAMHGAAEEHEIGLVFQAAETDAPEYPIEIIGGPGGDLHIRFSEEGRIVRTSDAAIGTASETPWDPWKLTIRQRIDQARRDRQVVAVDPARKTGRVPAVKLRLRSDDASTELWVQEGLPQTASVGAADYQIAFGEKRLPLGFQVGLDKFRVGTYPGSSQPRSFESRITITDPHAGGEISRIISMNHPTEYGGFTFYQSSFDKSGGEPVSVLSVSRDPGRPIVFAGYIGMLIGTIWVLVLRMQERRTEDCPSGQPRGDPPPCRV